MNKFSESATSLEKEFSEKLENISKSISAAQDAALGDLKQKIGELETQLKGRITEALDTEESKSAELLPEYEPEVGAEHNPQLVQDASAAMASIIDKWRNFKEELNNRIPLGLAGDQRALGAWARSRAAEENPPITPEQAEKIAALHGLYKSFTRRQSYANEWLTQERLDSFIRAVDSLIAELPPPTP